MLPAGFEPALPTALDGAATGIDYLDVISQHFRRQAEECNKTACIQNVAGQRFEPWTTRLENRNVGFTSFYVQ